MPVFNAVSLLAALLYLCVPPLAYAEPRLIEDMLAHRSTDDLPSMQERRQIRALVAYSETDFFIRPNGKPAGLQVELLNEYEKWINRGIRDAVDRSQIVLIPTPPERLLADLHDGKGDIAAALLTLTSGDDTPVAFATAAGIQVGHLLVSHAEAPAVTGLEDLAGREVVVAHGTGHARTLARLNDDLNAIGLTPVRIRVAAPDVRPQTLLQLVDAGEVELAVTDDHQARRWSERLAGIRVIEEVSLGESSPVGWAVRDGNPELLASVDGFMHAFRRGTLLGNVLFKRYLYRAPGRAADGEADRFRELVGIFSDYAETYGFDVLMTAAQAFQESRLDNSKRSHRGAVGIMQVLPSTAADPNVGIPNIRSLENNVHAGVKYLAFLRDRYFSRDEISPTNRMAFALAAYNAGPARVQRLRSRAREMGLDPDAWFGQVELMAAEDIGNETVNYVRNVFKYYLAYALVRDEIIAPRETAATVARQIDGDV
jgi:membrane-bound lytic murein transglycosylase MltF